MSIRSMITTVVMTLVLLVVSLPAVAQYAGSKETPEVTHNTWTTGTSMPTARFGAFAGAVAKNIYVIGGATNSGYQATNVNEIYNTKTNKWTTGAPDPTARELGASAVVNGI